jgi:ABC-type multidrug transport system fused ATPase/permease subunit
LEHIPKGLDAVVGAGGIRLSSGEKQRLSIARAILCNPDLVILDEVTANLDPETEDEIFQRMSGWLRRRAVILISHRPSTLVRADRILELRDGVLHERSVELQERAVTSHH